MATTTAQQQQIAADLAPPSASPKRPIDDEVEFISSKPVKKRRPTCQVDKKLGQQPLQFMLPPSQVASQQTAPGSATVPQIDQSTNALAANKIPAAPVADMSIEDDVVSVPLFGNFKFPPPHTISEPQRQRPSEEVSPRSFPQTITPAVLRFSAPPQPTSQNTLSSTVRLDQISCLDLNGSPVAAPRLNMGPDFSNTRSQPDSFIIDVSGPLANQSLAAPPIGSLNSQNAIPFAMYSTGNLVTLPQHQHTSLLSTSDANLSSSPFTGARIAASEYPSKGSAVSSGGVLQDYRHTGFAFNPSSHSGGNVPSTFAMSTAIPGSHSGITHRANCLVCAMNHSGANAMRPVYQTQSFQPHNGSSSYHRDPQDLSVSGYMASNATTLLTRQASGVDERAAMPPPPAPISSAPQRQQLSSQPIPTSSPPRNRKHAQNIFVDVAETVEAIFPYADVAARHGVAPSKVAGALSGVVLLPLLRCATDKRRAGPLAQARMREYREAKQSWPGGTSMSRGAPLGVAELVQVATSKGCSRIGGG
jgi:hypothetical protein